MRKTLIRIKMEALNSFCLLVLLLITWSSASHAQLTQNLTIGNPKALGLAHAITADPPGIDSIHFNPAGLAKVKGRRRMIKVIGAKMTLSTDFGDRHLEKAQTGSNGKTIEQTYVETYCGGVKTDTCRYPDDPFVENQSGSTSKPLLMLPGTGMTEVPFLAVPVAGIAIEDPAYGWTYATAIYSPLAFGYERDADDPAIYQAQRLAMSRITYFSPSIGFQINDALAFGASIGFSWQGFGVETGLRIAEPTLAFVAGTLDELNGAAGEEIIPPQNAPYVHAATLTVEVEDPLSFTFNIGLLWEPTEWLSFGLVYQSEGTASMSGDYKIEHSDRFAVGSQWLSQYNAIIEPLAGAGVNGKQVIEGTVDLELTSPAHFSVGTSVILFPNLKINFDIKWTDYSSWDAFELNFDQELDFLTQTSLGYALSAGYGDEDNVDPKKFVMKRENEAVVSWAIGFEYQANDRLVLRAGYEPRGSAIPDERFDLLAPLADAQLYALGFGYQWDVYSRIDASIAYLTSSFTSNAGESQSLNSTIPGQFAYNPYAYQDVSTTTTAIIFALSYEEKF